MVQKLRERSQGEGGFTLVELLVVMLILGLLAAIAIPSFFNQRDKAKDADAKASVRTAQTAMETYATGGNGSYANADAAALKLIEPTLNDVGANGLAVSNLGAKTYTVAVTSSTGNIFSITRADTGVTSYSCTVAAANGSERGGCPVGGAWAQ